MQSTDTRDEFPEVFFGSKGIEMDSNGRSPKLVQAALLASRSLYSLISCKLSPSLQTEEIVVASGTGHQIFPAWGHRAPSSPMHPGCLMAAQVGPLVLEPLYTAVGAGPGIRWDLPAPGCFAVGLKALLEPRSPPCCLMCLAQLCSAGQMSPSVRQSRLP